MYRRQIAQNEMVRKKFIDQYKKSFASSSGRGRGTSQIR